MDKTASDVFRKTFNFPFNMFSGLKTAFHSPLELLDEVYKQKTLRRFSMNRKALGGVQWTEQLQRSSFNLPFECVLCTEDGLPKPPRKSSLFRRPLDGFL